MNCSNAAPELMFTGERIVPGKTPPFLIMEHLVRYRFAARFTDGLKTLDVGCGTGYGTAILGETSSFVAAVDSDREAIHYADKVYSRPNLRFTQADCRHLPFANGLFGLVVSFELIEHMSEQDQCLGEIRRVLSPDGILVLSTPNALRSTKVIEEANPFHHKELTEDEFKELLGRHFEHVQLLYQHEFSASSIEPTAPEKTEPVEMVVDLAGTPPPKYFVAVCGAQPTTVSRRRSLGVGGIEHQIAITRDVRDARKEIDALLRQREQNGREYSENLTAHRREIDRLQGEIGAFLRQREQNGREYSENLTVHRREIDRLQNEIGALLRQREQNGREYSENLAAHRHEIDRLQGEIGAFLRQREQNEREYGENLAAHRREIDRLQGEISALLRQREQNGREYNENLAAQRHEIDALLRQREESEREYARNLAAQAEVIRQQKQQCAVQRIELEWLYRWIPVNKLARRLLFGRNLRDRLRSILRSP